jgi:NAD(P)-dependent dehydrogenase (short-subunit alcohol dehydrogenase family)
VDLGLKGKVALITGGSEGIGKATAEELAREGAVVAICARREDVLQQAADDIHKATGTTGAVLPVRADVSQAEDVTGLVRTVEQKLGPITLLVNNAGTSAARPFESVSDEDWYADLDLKLMGAIRVGRLVVPGMRTAGGGRIVNVTAVGGKTPAASSTPTSVSRAAGIALTKAMSKELAKDNILVNTVCIGLVKSGQISRMAGTRFPDTQSLDEAYARMGAGVPLGRIGESSEVAALIAFLLSARGSYITGVAINVDGGTAAVV